MRDFGYDVSDFCDVDPIFGRLSDFEALLEAAHARDIRVILDWVPAHTSSDHAWFQEARRSRTNPRRDWYIWRDPGPDGALPNNWRAALPVGIPAWTLDETTGQFYLHSFLRDQPDLNWANPEVEEAMHAVLRFWLDRGVDGFRADVIHNIGKDPALPDVEARLAPIPHGVLNDEPVTHEYLRRIRRLLDSYPGDRMMVGEVWLLTTEQIGPYFGKGDELHLSFNFPPLFAEWTAASWRKCLEKTWALLDPLGAWPSWVLSNHDVVRHRTRYGSEARARAAAVMLLSLRGTPFLYMGEELGLEDARVPEERVVDPGGRDGCRSPIPWRAEPPHGWGREPWLPWSPEAGARSVETQRGAPDSILHLYRRLLAARRGSEALRLGSFEFMAAPECLLAYRRRAGSDRRTVIVSFADAPIAFDPGDALRVEVASDGVGEGDRFSGTLGPDQGLILR
jgi:alpha-glucosidase